VGNVERPDGHAAAAPPKSAPTPWAKRFAWLPIPLFLAAVAVLARLDTDLVYNPPFLIPALNILFLTVVSIVVSSLAARSYLARRASATLFLGCGTLALGLGGLVAVVPFSRPAPNWMVTNYNGAAFIAAVCHLISAVWGSQAMASRVRRPGPLLAGAYLAVVAVISLLASATHEGLLPPFFIEGTGATPWNIATLGCSTILFALAALLLQANHREQPTLFTYWYSLGRDEPLERQIAEDVRRDLKS
jgi:uncharacterized membrane protein